MFSQLSNNLKGIILAIIGFGAFAVSDAVTKWLSLQYHVIQIVSWNAVFAFIALLIFSRFLGGFKKTFQTRKRHIHIARGLCNTVIAVLVTFSFSKLPLASVYTLLFIAPFLTTLFAIPIYKEQVDRHGWMAIIFGFLGVLIVVRPGFTDMNAWLFLPIATAVFVSCMALMARGLGEDETLLSLAVFPVASNLLFLALPSLFLFEIPDPAHLGFFALCGITVAIGLITIARAFRIAKTSIVSPIHYTQIIWGILFGYFIFTDLPNIGTILGAFIIIGSGIYLIETERKTMKYGPDHT